MPDHQSMLRALGMFRPLGVQRDYLALEAVTHAVLYVYIIASSTHSGLILSVNPLLVNTQCDNIGQLI